ncbi:UNKNOWN [Stylonychia lemnae]|uniref:Uncharacterized protein n=1 Tax=Stylonychia lemnae TaxID=5949 RepID=A0A077ZQP0_STYLE|nr:UNKNOWN [Stylonychia lemnae]|eukprot:CDW72238.1 UNKNOWN [Stylonychia lemnae]
MHGSMEDLYFQIWAKYIDSDKIKSTLLTFIEPSNPLQKLLSFGYDYDKDNIVQLKLQVFDQVYQSNDKVLSDYQKNHIIVFDQWNSYQLYMNATKIIFNINDIQLAEMDIVDQDMIQRFLTTQVYDENKIIPQCELGVDNFNGYMRHVIIAYSFKDFKTYQDHYLHRFPSPLDTHIILYQSLEQNLGHQYWIDTNNIDSQISIQFDKQNEPDQICKCESDQSQSSNYLILSSKSFLDDHYLDNQQFKISISAIQFSFTINIHELLTVKEIDLFKHEGVFRILINQKLKLQFIISQTAYTFDMDENKNFNRSIFINSWMNYTLDINSQQLNLTLNDFTQQSPVKFSINIAKSDFDAILNSINQKESQILKFGVHNIQYYLLNLKYVLNKNTVVIDQSFSRDNFISTQQFESPQVSKQIPIVSGYFTNSMANFTSIGALFQQIRGPCNFSDESFGFDGIVCKDLRKYVGFNINQQSQGKGLVQNLMVSSNGQFTFETWFKFIDFVNSGQQNATIMTNYQYLTNPLIAIQIAYSNGYYVECNPYFQTKKIEGFLDSVVILSGDIRNQWVHMACISNNDLSVQQLKMILFNHKTQLEFSQIRTNSYTINLPNKNPIKTILGNNQDENSPFKGFIRETRVWGSIRQFDEIKKFRYQSLPLFERTQMFSQIQLNQGLGDRSIQLFSNLNDLDFYSFSKSTPISWVIDEDLTICPENTLYYQPTQCCLKDDYTIEILKIFTENQKGENQILLTAKLSYLLIPQRLSLDLFQFNWTLKNILNYEGNGSLEQHFKEVKQYIEQQNDQENINKITILEDMLDAKASYIIQAQISSKIRRYNRTLSSLYELKPECPIVEIQPIYNTNHIIRVHQKMSPQNLVLHLDIQDKCSVITTIKTIVWEQEQTGSYFDISSDNKSIQFTKLNWISQYLQLTVSIRYEQNGQIKTIGDYVSILLVSQPINLQLSPISQKIELPQSVLFDPSQTIFNVDYYDEQDIQYSLECPDVLFYEMEDKDNICQPDSKTGRVVLSPNDLKIIRNANYQFKFQISSNYLNYIDSKLINLQFYKIESHYCPDASMQQYTYFQKSQEIMLFQPSISLDCRTSLNYSETLVDHYVINRVIWIYDNQEDTFPYLSISQDGLIAYLKDDLRQKILPGYNNNVALKVLINDTWYNSSTWIVLQKSRVQIQIETNFQNNQVEFDQVMILNASKSYDSDYPDDPIEFKWQFSANPELNDQDFGLNDVLKLNPITRLKLNSYIGYYYSFAISASNSKYENSEDLLNLDIKFLKYDLENLRDDNCAPKVDYDTPTLIFSNQNGSDINFDVSIDSQQCQDLKVYQGIFVMFRSDQRDHYIGQQQQILWQSVLDLHINQTITLDFIYLFQTGPSKTDEYYDYIIKTLNIQKVASPLATNLNYKDELILIGQYEIIKIDASNTKDPDLQVQPNFSFNWGCPINFKCQQTGSSLQISKQMRIDGNQNAIGSEFTITLVISSNRKQISTQLQFKIVEQDFNKCIDMALEQTDNNIQIKRDQQFPSSIRLNTKLYCDQIKIDNIQWQSTDSVIKFWLADQDGLSMNIKSGLYLPKDRNEINMIVQLKYTWTDETDFQIKSITKKIEFVIKLLASDLKSVIKIQNQVIWPEIQNLFIDASQSIDPDNTNTNLICTWVCPSNLKNQDFCKGTTADSCILNLPQQSLTRSQINIEYEQILIQVQISDETGQRQQIQNISVTIISDSIATVLPLCNIISFKGDQFLIDDQMTLYPQCNYFTQSGYYSSEFLKLNYQWQISPMMQGIAKNDIYLRFNPFQLAKDLDDKIQRKLYINLTISTSDTKMAQNLSYSILKIFELPSLIDEQFSQGYVSVLPSQGYSMFSTFQLEIKGIILKNNQYFRLRVEKSDNTSQVILHKAQNYTYLVNFPKYTSKVYVDLINGQKTSSNNYSIYTMNVNVEISEFSVLTLQAFNQLVIPQLAREIQIYDYSDLAQIEIQLNTYYGLAIAISNVNIGLQTQYYDVLISRILLITQKLVYNYFDDNERLLLKSLLLKISSIAYGQMINSTNSELPMLKQMIFENFLHEDNLIKIQDSMTTSEIVNGYARSVANLIQKIWNDADQKLGLERIFYQIVTSNLVQGETLIFDDPMDQSSKLTLYRIKQLDIVSLSPLTQKSPIVSDLTTYTIYELASYNEAQFVLSGFRKNAELSSFENQNISQQVSRTQLKINLLDRYLEKIEVRDISGISIEFPLQNSLLKYLETTNQIDTSHNLLKCVSKSDDEISFNLNNTDVTMDFRKFQNGIVACNSSHLSVFDVVYLPLQILPADIDKREQRRDKISIFQTLPILNYVVPAIFFFFTLIMIVAGALMNNFDQKRPKRFYNKLSFIENIQKHSYLRLLGSMILLFNPFFNYIIKPNHYLSRPLRLMFIQCYFLGISAISIAIFEQRKDRIQIRDIFQYSFIMIICITLFRPLLQRMYFSLFYPQTLKNWRYETNLASEKRRMIGDDDQEDADFNGKQKRKSRNEDNSIRLENSMNRMIGEDYSSAIVRLEKNANSDDEVKGDEIINYRRNKTQVKTTTQSQELKKNNKNIKRKDSQKQSLKSSGGDIELQDFKPKTQQNSQKGSQESHLQENYLNEMNQIETFSPQHDNNNSIRDVNFPQIEQDQINGNHSSSEDIIIIDHEKQNKIQDQQDEEINVILDEDYMDKQQYEGGEVDQDNSIEIIDDNLEEEKQTSNVTNSFNNNNSNLVKAKKPKKRRRNADQQSKKPRKNHQRSLDDNEEIGDDIENQSNIDESTPSLEGIFDNFRQLQKEPVSPCRKVSGLLLVIIVLIGLIVIHIQMLDSLQENQFQNWFSCTLFTFIFQIFVVDTLIYAFVALRLKRKKNQMRKAGCFCLNRDKVLIVWPLGYFKFTELEIEVAKLKDFDEEYKLLIYV